MITMLLGGLWHGAAWTFVAWGFFHGGLIVSTHILSTVPALKSFVHSQSWPIQFIKWSITFYLMLLGWVFFRALDIDSAFEILMSMHLFNELPQAAANAGLIAVLTIFAVFFMHALDFVIIRFGEKLENRGWILWPMLIVLHFFCFAIGEPGDAFIYFQF